MSMLRYVAVIGLGGALALSGCSKGSKSGGTTATPAAGAKTGEAKKAAAPAEKKGGGELEITKLGLKAKAPAGAKAGDAIVGEGALIQGPGLVVTVEIANDMHSATIEAAKEDASMYSPKNLKAEKLADGFIVTYENKGAMGKNFFVNARRKIGDKSYWCSTTASQPIQSTNAIAFCKSLHK